MKKREAITEAIEAWASALNAEAIGGLRGDDPNAHDLRAGLSEQIVAALKASRKKRKRK